MKYAIICAALLLAGCSQRDAVPDVPSSNQPALVKHDVGYNYVYELRLSDGTRCAVLSGYYAGGVSCNWRNNNEQ